MTTRWSETDRVWYCETHDALVRNWMMRDDLNTAQCDWARAMQIPLIYEECEIGLADLIVTNFVATNVEVS